MQRKYFAVEISWYLILKNEFLLIFEKNVYCLELTKMDNQYYKSRICVFSFLLNKTESAWWKYVFNETLCFLIALCMVTKICSKRVLAHKTDTHFNEFNFALVTRLANEADAIIRIEYSGTPQMKTSVIHLKRAAV